MHQMSAPKELHDCNQIWPHSHCQLFMTFQRNSVASFCFLPIQHKKKLLTSFSLKVNDKGSYNIPYMPI